MLKSKSVEFSPGKFGRPDQSGAQWTGSLARVSVPCRNIPAGRRMSGLQPGPTGLTAGPSGLHFGGAELIAELRHELFQRPDFDLHLNTPSPSWGNVRTSPTIVHP
jgi:hypothetical protein